MNEPSVPKKLHSTCCGFLACAGPEVRLECPAKLNVFLEIVGRRPDGYHELDTVMLRTQFCDQLTIRTAADGRLTLRFSDATPEPLRTDVPLDERNLILRAALALRESSGCRQGAEFILHKRIPPESGLAGGSSNAASALAGLRQLWRLPTDDQELHAIAASLGSDINFLLSGSRAALCRGRGEILTPIRLSGDLFFVAARPDRGNSTGAVFRQADLESPRYSSDTIVRCLESGCHQNLPHLIFNRLTSAAESLNPEMCRLMQRMRTLLNRPVFMSGSGSTVFAAADNHRQATAFLNQIRSQLRIRGWLLKV